MHDPLPHRPRAMVFGVVVPLLIHLAGVIVVAAIWGRLPGEMVVHVGPGGQRTGSPMEVVAPLTVIGGVGTLVLVGLSMTVGRTSVSRRMVLGIATGWAALMVGMVLAFLLPQVGGGSASFDGPLGLAFAVALLAGILAASQAGNDPLLPATKPVPADAPRTPEGTNDSQVWDQQAGISARGWAWFSVLAALCIAGAIALGVATGSWLVVAVLVIAPLLPPPMLRWHVRVDATGLTVTGAFTRGLGWPRHHVPAAEVLRADAIEVKPFDEFGGFGLRIAPDRHGTVAVAMRQGSAIAVQRTGGRRFVVTVDDAETGAALLNTMADRARTTPRVT